MKQRGWKWLMGGLVWILPLMSLNIAMAQAAPLPSWKYQYGGMRLKIIHFVHDVTDPHSCQYVPAQKRVATFDLFGTLVGENAHHSQNAADFGKAYQPMRELVSYLRENDFSCWIVSDAGDQMIENYAKPGYQTIVSKGHLINARGEQKATAIMKKVGIKPIFAAGNNYGDYAMLSLSHQQPQETMQLLIHHDDAIREHDYAEKSEVQKATAGHWQLVSMKDDWKKVFWNFNLQSQK